MGYVILSAATLPASLSLSLSDPLSGTVFFLKKAKSSLSLSLSLSVSDPLSGTVFFKKAKGHGDSTD